MSSTVDETVAASAASLPRFLRIVSGSALSEEEVAAELGPSLAPVTWLPISLRLYALDPSVRIKGTRAYESGHVFGVDASSCAAVLALGVRPGDHCLDLCCAPGAKLALMSELASPRGSVTGVDVSRERLSACRTVAVKYTLPCVRLFCCDAREFGKPAPRFEWDATAHTHFEDAVAAQSSRMSRLGLDARSRVDEGSVVDESDARSAKNGTGNSACAAECVAADSGTCEGGECDAAHAEESEQDERMERASDERQRCEERKRPAEQEVGDAYPAKRPRGQRLKLSRRQKRAQCRAYAETPLNDGTDGNFYASDGYKCLVSDAARASLCAALAASEGLDPFAADQLALYDRVLVDAECTHDGSLKHVAKFGLRKGWAAASEHVGAPERVLALAELQRGLISAGFSKLRAGGTMVYSTCSMSAAQNEEVVAWLLERESTASLAPISLCDVNGLAGMEEPPCARVACVPGGPAHALRFDPAGGRVSGLFVARIEKALAVRAVRP